MRQLRPAKSLYVDYDKSLKIINAIFLCWGFITVVNNTLFGAFVSGIDITESSVYPFLEWLQNDLTGGVLPFVEQPTLIFGFIFFSTYFLCGLPVSYLVYKKGFKRSIEIGLILAASAVFLLVPGARNQSLPLFMLGVFVQVAGITVLQVACNPYVIFVGPPEGGSSRLSMAGAHNSFGTWIAPLIGTLISTVDIPTEVIGTSMEQVLKTELVVLPYVLITVLFIGMAVLIEFSDLPDLNDFRDIDTNIVNDNKKNIFQYPHVVLGAVAILAYVCAEVLIGVSVLTPYLEKHITSPELAGSIVLVTTYFWGGAMVGRFIGASILQNTLPRKVLMICALCALGLSLVAGVIPTQEAMFFILAIGLFNGVMWPIIFDLAVRGLGRRMPFASGLMITGIIGAAIAFGIAGAIYVPAAEGLKKHDASMNNIIFIAAICYAFIVFYAIRGHKYKMKEKILSNE